MTCRIILPVTLTIPVADVDAVLLSFDQIKIFRSTTVESGPYAEITNSLTRLVLVSGTSEYTYEDTEGSAEYFYKYAFYNSVTLTTDTLSAAMAGAPDPALSVISVEEVKTNYLFGLDLTRDDGTPYPDSLYAHFIKSAVAWLEHRLDIPILEKMIEEERHDYFREDYDKYIFVPTDLKPVIEIFSVRMVLPGENEIRNFTQDWIHVQRLSGQINMVPAAGSIGTTLIGSRGSLLPFIHRLNNFIPDVFRVSYRAGFGKKTTGIGLADPTLDTVPYDIVDLVGKIATFGPLNIAGDLLGGAGIASQSLSLDGLSQSFNTTSSSTSAGYGARLIQYQKEIKEWVPTLRRFYHGPALMAV